MTGKVRLRDVLLLTLLAILGLGLMTADPAWAGSWGRGGWGPGANLTPEQAGQVFDLRQIFFNDTADRRRQMMKKRAELAAMWNSPSPDQGQISAKQKELWALQEQLQAQAATHRTAVGKIAPAGYGPGLGRGLAGGKGRGRCW
jgi:Spy/CpxP family protein refolding chaperone